MTLDEELKSLIQQAHLNITDDIRSALIQYVVLIQKWNKVHNLTAIREDRAMLVLHIMDSLAVLPLLPEGNTLLDVGSGAGLPGIVIALSQPSIKVTVIDASQKKASFMRQVKSELGLDNLSVVCGRVEKLPSQNKFDIIISRAFSDLFTFVSLTKDLCKPTGQWVAMKGTVPNDEIQALRDKMGIKVSKIEQLVIPQLEAERHLVFISQQPIGTKGSI